jgi:hypothetical protein
MLDRAGPTHQFDTALTITNCHPELRHQIKHARVMGYVTRSRILNTITTHQRC